MAEIGEVIGTEKNKLVVRMTRKEACAKCRACSAGLKEQDMLLKAVNLCNAKVGDKVEVMLETADFMKATCIMYGIPCAMFI
ncbi:MAG: SoxR reducing system RseC family protein, partial [Muribaculaceae bacterium]